MKLRNIQLLSKWRKLKTLSKLNKLIKVAVMIVGLSISIFSLLTFISLERILYNIEIPSDIPELHLDFSHYSKIQNTSIRIPYRISNNGFVDIKRIYLRFQIDISYTENRTYQKTQVAIISRQISLGDCPTSQSIRGEITGDFHDLNTTALGIYMSEVDRYQEETRLLSIGFSAYLADVIFFQFTLNNLTINDGDCNDCG